MLWPSANRSCMDLQFKCWELCSHICGNLRLRSLVQDQEVGAEVTICLCSTSSDAESCTQLKSEDEGLNLHAIRYTAFWIRYRAFLPEPLHSCRITCAFSDDSRAPPLQKAGFNTVQCCKLSVTILKATSTVSKSCSPGKSTKPLRTPQDKILKLSSLKFHTGNGGR